MLCRKCKKEIPDGSTFCNWCGARQVLASHPKKRGNGQGTVIKLPNGKYKAIVTLGYYMGEDSKRHARKRTRTFIKRSDAIAALPSMKTDVSRVPDMNLHDLHELYLASSDYAALSKSQRDKLGFAWTRWTDHEFTGIAQLTVADIEACIEKHTSSFYPARDMKVMLSHLYRIAIKKEILQYNKTDYVEIPFDSPKAKRDSWTTEEVEALWQDYPLHPFTGYILVMCYAGLRYGELSTILVENVHLDERYMVGGIKSEAGIDRTIPISKRIVPVIRALLKPGQTKLIHMNEDRFYASYWETIHRTGLRELPPQTCRHFFFSRMTAAGIQGGIIAEVGGHANYLTTLKNYVRIPLDDKLTAVDQI